MNDFVTKLKQKWVGLEPGDQRALKLGGGAVAILMVFGLVLMPMYQSLQSLEKQLPNMRQQLRVMGMQAIEVKRLRATPVSTQSGASLLSALEKSVNSNNLKSNVQSLTPRDSNTATLQLGAVHYSKLVQWLAKVDAQHLMRLSEADLRKTEAADVIDATLVFTVRK